VRRLLTHFLGGEDGQLAVYVFTPSNCEGTWLPCERHVCKIE